MSKLLSQNGKILITSAGALAIESTGGGGYDITATENADGTQSLAIVDGQGGSSGGGSGGTIEEVTITFKGGNSFYVAGTGSSGIINNVLYATGDTVKVLKNSIVLITSKDQALSIPRIESGNITHCSLGTTENISGFLTMPNWPANHSGCRIICYANEDFTIFADVD